MKRMPVVSVVMPVYNSENYVREAVESILNQTYENLELIAVIDAPTDNTANILSQFENPKLKVFYNETNKGISYTTNRGIDLSVGKYIAFMDDDDIAPRDRIAIEVDFLEKHLQYDVVGGAHCQMDADGNDITFPIEQKSNPKYIKAYYLFGEVGIYNGTMMVRRDFLDKYSIRCRENCYGMQDLQFYMECSKYGNITTLRKLMLHHRQHNNNACEKNKIQHVQKRKEAFARFQRQSLGLSGYTLLNEDMKLINRVITEFKEDYCQSIDEFMQLKNVLAKILNQGKEMNIDYYEELEIVCKVLLSKQILKMPLFK